MASTPTAHMPRPSLTKRPYGTLMVRAVERAVVQRWDSARARALGTSGTTDDRIREVRKNFRRELVTLGAAAGGSAAVPGIGTATAIGLTASELAWTASRATDMILTVAAIHGHLEASVEERKAWTLALFAFDDGGNGVKTIAQNYNDLATELDHRGVGQRGPLPPQLLDSLNSRLGRYVITKYGARRSAVLMGKVLPFGLGALVGGSANHRMVSLIIDRADRFFSELTVTRGANSTLPASDLGLLPPPAAGSKPPPPPPTLQTPAAKPRDPRRIIDL